MKTFKHLLLLSVVVVLAVLRVDAQENVTPQPPEKYRIELVYIFEPTGTEFIFVIGNSGFKSVAALKAFVGNLPPGTTLEWAPGCVRMGGEPLLSSDEEMLDFKTFCTERNINFILVPSG